jgi:hypothetical protein
MDIQFDKKGAAYLRDVKVFDGSWKNFGGEASQYNKDGKIFFNAFISQHQAEELRSHGFCVKEREGRDGGDTLYYMNVKVNMDGMYPPKIKLVQDATEQYIDRNSIKLLDQIHIDHATIVVNPYHWETNIGSGVTAYLNQGKFYSHTDFIDQPDDYDITAPNSNYVYENDEEAPF